MNSSRSRRLGFSRSSVAVSLATWGASVALIACTGDDDASTPFPPATGVAIVSDAGSDATTLGMGDDDSDATVTADSGADGSTVIVVTGCPTGEATCGVDCVQLSSDGQNCGACGHACASGQACVASSCTTTCPASEKLCAGETDGGASTCSNLSTDDANCGACGTKCAAGSVCSGGKCATSCAAGFATCTPDAGTGAAPATYCADETYDPNNCGACGHICTAAMNESAFCTASTCGQACNTGYADCNRLAMDGCEANLATDAKNCNTCGTACAANLACRAGACVCAGGAAGTVGAVDQAQITAGSVADAMPGQTVGQTFTAGATGLLTGIEVGLTGCSAVDPNAKFKLAVLANNVTLGSASITAAAVIAACGGNGALSATAVGNGFFDLSGQCINVTAGEALSFVVTVTSTSVPACAMGTFTCSAGTVGAICFLDANCAFTAGLGASTANPYANGTETISGTAQAGSDLAFKTFVH